MFSHKETDIVVLGAGPVGLMAAHALSHHDRDYILLDREQRTHVHSYALTLHPETLELLDSLGLVERVLENALQVHTVRIYEGDHPKAVLDYSMLPLKYPFLAVIRQNELEQILVDHLTRKDQQPHWNHRVRFIEDSADGLNISVDRLTEGMTGYAVAHLEMQIDKILNYQANYLIGADGHASTARYLAGIEFPEIGPSMDYAIFEFKTDMDLPKEMRLIIHDDKTHIYWPLPNGYCRWSFQVEPNSALIHSLDKDHRLVPFDHDTMLLERDYLDAYLAENAPWFDGSIQDIHWRMLARFENRLASAFGKHRIWLAGDSAHLAPQAGTLSMNVGIREVIDLVNRLEGAHTEMACQKALADYNQHRLAEWQHLLNLDQHISAADQHARWILNHPSLIGNIPASGETLTELLAQLHLINAA